MRLLAPMAAAVMVACSLSIPVSGSQGGQSAPEVFVADPEGDVRPGGAPNSSPGIPASPATAAMDLVGLRVFGEDLEAFEVELRLSDMRSALGSLQAGLFDTGDFGLRFGLAETSLTYEVRWSIQVPLPDRTPVGRVPVWTKFCLLVPGSNCLAQRVVGNIDWDNSHLHARITKAALLGQEPRGGNEGAVIPPGIPTSLGDGAVLAGFVGQTGFAPVDSSLGVGTPAHLEDRVPDTADAGPFVLQRGLPAGGIRVGLGQPDAYQSLIDEAPGLGAREDFPRVPVPPGVHSAIQVRVHNDAPVPRILNLSHEWMDPSDAAKWPIRLVPTVTVPANASRLVNLIVDGPALDFGESSLLQLIARDASAVDVAAAKTIRLVAAARPPSPILRDVHLHAAADPYAYSFINDVFCLVPLCGNAPGWLNTAATDPRGTLDQGLPLSAVTVLRFPELSTLESRIVFPFDLGLPFDLVLDPDQPVEARLAFRSEVPLEAEITAYLEHEGGTAGPASAGLQLVGEAEIALRLPIDPRAARIPAGDRPRLALTLSFSIASAAPAAFAASPPELVPARSLLVLPLIPDPEAKILEVPAGPAAITLYSDGPATRFVNPGATAVFRATVVNEGILEDAARLEESHEPPDWRVRIEPAKRFPLESGESALVALLVDAPAAAPEGKRFLGYLNATSEADPRARATLVFHVTAVAGVVVDEDADSPVFEDGSADANRTPGWGVAAVFAAGAAAVWGRRRS